MAEIVVAQQFCGPPNSGNGGYCCGVLAKDIEGVATAVLRARIPLDVALNLEVGAQATELFDGEGALIGKGVAASAAELPDVPAPPSLAEAKAAESRYIGLTQRIHPTCFSCGPEREEGSGLKVFAGQIEGAPAGYVACPWTPHANFADSEGLTPIEVIWAALDCPGFFAWVVKEGRHGALLGTMTGEVVRRPAAGETCIVTAWPIAREGRKETAGVALHTADGELLARAHQVWIMMGPPPQAAAATPAVATA
ncbi:MAG TPA: hypothetical protein VFW47_14140 [Phenylobacterium sp.]|nr:hypothetical protein [Phenylobacterium sp.]